MPIERLFAGRAWAICGPRGLGHAVSRKVRRVTAKALLAIEAAAFLPALVVAGTPSVEVSYDTLGPPPAARSSGTLPATARDTISLTDDEGVVLAFPAPPARVVSLLPAATEILFALDAGDRLVGRTRFDAHPPEVLDIPSVGDGVRPSVELILAQRPDLVILFSGPDSRAAADALRRVGIAVLALRHNTIADLHRNVSRLGRISGRDEEAKALSAGIARDLARTRQITRQLPQRSVYYDAWWHPPITIGGGSYLDSLITLAGGRNVFGDLQSPSPQVNLEAIADRRPEIILYPVHRGVEGRAPIAERPGWEVLSAVREDRVREFDAELVVRLGPRIGAAVRQLAAAIHPTVFFLRASPTSPEQQR